MKRSAESVNQIKLTKARVDAVPLLADLKPGDKVRQRFYFDTDLRGFGLRVGATAKTYFVQREVHGRTRRITIGRHGTLTPDQARREAQQLSARMALGVDPNEEKRKKRARGFTLREALELAEQVLRTRKRSDKTIHGYRYNVETYLKDWLDRPLREIGRADLRQRHQRIARDIAAGKYANGRGRGESHGEATANAVVVAFRTIYNRATEEHADLPANPVVRFHFFKVERRRKELPLSRLHEWHGQALAIGNPVRRDLLLFMLHTGLRRGDATAARWEHVDLARRVLRVPNPKGGKERAFDLPLTAYLVRLLRARRKENAEIFDDSPWVFPAESESGHIAEPREEFDGVDWTPHDTRRWFQRAAESLDVSPYAIKLLVNHSLPGGDVTARYMDLEIERLRPVMEKIGARLRELCHHNQNTSKRKRQST